jgi:hypothetical protein
MPQSEPGVSCRIKGLSGEEDLTHQDLRTNLITFVRVLAGLTMEEWLPGRSLHQELSKQSQEALWNQQNDAKMGQNKATAKGCYQNWGFSI